MPAKEVEGRRDPGEARSEASTIIAFWGERNAGGTGVLVATGGSPGSSAGCQARSPPYSSPPPLPPAAGQTSTGKAGEMLE